MSEDPRAKAEKQIHIAMRSRRPLAAYARTEDLKEILLDLVTTTAVLFGTVPEDVAVKMFRDCLHWVRGDAEAAPPAPPETLN
jgi:hypothetical protein